MRRSESPIVLFGASLLLAAEAAAAISAASLAFCPLLAQTADALLQTFANASTSPHTSIIVVSVGKLQICVFAIVACDVHGVSVVQRSVLLLLVVVPHQVGAFLQLNSAVADLVSSESTVEGERRFAFAFEIVWGVVLLEN